MTKPIRIQRQRTRGWKMPPNAVYVGRPSKWGNPYHVGQRGQLHLEPMTDAELLAFDFSERTETINGREMRLRNAPPNRIIPFEKPLTVEDVLLLFHKHLLEKNIDLSPLRGKNLACWCPLDQPCHADVLLKLANS